MPHDPIPKDPVYMSYITRHHQEVQHPSPHRSSSPFRPLSGLTYTDQQLQGSRSVYPHFHRPFNDHSRYLAVASGADRGVYRDLPRLPPPPWDGTNPADDTAAPRRPLSAPPPTGGRGNSGDSSSGSPHGGVSGGATPNLRLDLRGVTLTDNMTTPTGRPCYTITALVEADLESGTPVPPDVDDSGHRVAVVQTYPVPPSVVGYGNGGVRPFHQDYRHYKYYGFAGKGAKTSWAHNPKFSKIYADLLTANARDSTGPPGAPGGVPVPPPLQDVVGGPRRPLTATERKLVGQFQWHNYGAEGVPSDPKVTRLLAHVATGTHPTPRTLRHLKLPQQGGTGAEGGAGGGGGGGASPSAMARQAAAGQQYGSFLEGEVIEPYRTRVDLQSRRPMTAQGPPGGRRSAAGGDGRSARVSTYRQMSSPYAAEINRSPNHGSQSPWHQRYGHYKYSGFAGQGATSSWARNPKYAYMYD
ncbi:hypothetical protein PLESTB_000111300 [Pleodorina starrii]|uniref:Uncharacterized protein n=1 Tax=Pleodorina starrii TaxID=330485 RepID=A0A9W6BB66_9CHLO|nr:hypothetical protein PLESTM_000106700 [Pleodorina starrii]GLC48560.1 hypothetical protein PLESTB_000111300 [Pleodorina starrii]GLC71880.1 hypothetical protein PLESTF_001176900 [Pleodorina starrii]